MVAGDGDAKLEDKLRAAKEGSSRIDRRRSLELGAWLHLSFIEQLYSASSDASGLATYTAWLED